MELNQEQKELLQELVVSDSWPALVAVCEIFLNKTAEQILKTTYTTDRELSLAKAKYDGAVSLFVSLKGLKESIKEKRSSYQKRA